MQLLPALLLFSFGYQFTPMQCDHREKFPRFEPLSRNWSHDDFQDFFEFSGDGPGNGSTGSSVKLPEAVVTFKMMTATQTTLLPSLTEFIITTPSFFKVSISPSKTFEKPFVSTMSFRDPFSRRPTAELVPDSLSVIARVSKPYLGPSSSIISPLSSFSPAAGNSDLITSSSQFVEKSSLETIIKAASESILPSFTPVPSSTIYYIPDSSETTLINTLSLSSPTTILPSLVAQKTTSLSHVNSEAATKVIKSTESSNSKVINNTPVKDSKSSHVLPTQIYVPSSSPTTHLVSSVSGLTENEKSTTVNTLETTLSSESGDPSVPIAHLVRTVLANGTQFRFKNASQILEQRLLEAFRVAYVRFYGNISTDSAFEVDRFSVKMKNMFLDSNHNLMHLIYVVQDNDEKLSAENVRNVLRFITEKEMSLILKARVILKAEPFYADESRDKDGTLLGGDVGWLLLALITLSSFIVLICLLCVLTFWLKQRKVQRKLVSKMNENNKVSPKDQTVNWRQISEGSRSSRKKGSPPAHDVRHEFEYVSFNTPQTSIEIRDRPSWSKSKSHVKTNLEIQKEKVVPIASLDKDGTKYDRVSVTGSEFDKKTFVTTIDEDVNYEEEEVGPSVLQVHIGNNTESIIRAIRTELNRFSSANSPYPTPSSRKNHPPT